LDEVEGVFDLLFGEVELAGNDLPGKSPIISLWGLKSILFCLSDNIGLDKTL
jgi:hypothetical protein